MRGDAWTETEQTALREIVAQLDSLDDSTGGWTSKREARQTGFSLHIKFDKKVSIEKTLESAAVFENAPMKLMQIVARVVGQLDAAAAPPSDSSPPPVADTGGGGTGHRYGPTGA